MHGRLVLTSLILITACSSWHEELPEPFQMPSMHQVAESIPWPPLAEAELRHRNGIECGTQYLFEMADLADQAYAAGATHALVAAIMSGPGRQEAVMVLGMLGPDAANVAPDLVQLAGSSNPEAADAALRAIDGMTYVNRCPEEPRVWRRGGRRHGHGG
jgi:hypothetical protein